MAKKKAEEAKDGQFGEWAILELMGHRRLAGFVSEQQIGGASFIRVDVPGKTAKDKPTATQFYAPGSVYCITPVTETLARQVAIGSQPAPVTRSDLPQLPAGRHGEGEDFE